MEGFLNKKYKMGHTENLEEILTEIGDLFVQFDMKLKSTLL